MNLSSSNLIYHTKLLNVILYIGLSCCSFSLFYMCTNCTSTSFRFPLAMSALGPSWSWCTAHIAGACLAWSHATTTAVMSWRAAWPIRLTWTPSGGTWLVRRSSSLLVKPLSIWYLPSSPLPGLWPHFCFGGRAWRVKKQLTSSCYTKPSLSLIVEGIRSCFTLFKWKR